MSRFNKSTRNKAKTTNQEGAVAYKFLDTKQEFLNTAAGMGFLGSGFYKTEDALLQLLLGMVAENPTFAATVAAHLRNDQNYRTIPLVILAALTQTQNGDRFNVRKLVPQVVRRADEMAEVLAIYKHIFQKPALSSGVSHSLLKGLADVANTFDRYQYGKYNRAKADVKLRDVLRLVHPTPVDEEHDDIFDSVIEGTLSPPVTWEVILSASGEKSKAAKMKALQPLIDDISRRGELPETWRNLEEKLTDSPMSKKEAWSMVLDLGNRFPYMAALRNLRNILEAGVDAQRITKLADRLADPKQVARSRQLPFRFFSAAKALLPYTNADRVGSSAFDRISYSDAADGTVEYVIESLEKAVVASSRQLPQYEGTTVIGCDISGSMDQAVSGNSTIKLYEIALLFGILTYHSNPNAAVGAFGSQAAFYTKDALDKFGSHPLKAAYRAYAQMQHLGFSTNGHLIVEALIDLYNQKRIDPVDRVILFTDCQLWDTADGWRRDSSSLQKAWNTYKQIAPNAKLYIINLAGYRTCPVNPGRPDVVTFAGWSDHILRYIANYEQSRDVIDEIEGRYPGAELITPTA